MNDNTPGIGVTGITTTGSFGYEPRSHPRRAAVTSEACPIEFGGCGGGLTRWTRSGKTPDGQHLRKRKCRDCGLVIVTVEQIVVVREKAGHEPYRLATFIEVDDAYRRRNTEWARQARGTKNPTGPIRKPRPIHGSAYIIAPRT
jgi:hypothetical protein